MKLNALFIALLTIPCATHALPHWTNYAANQSTHQVTINFQGIKDTLWQTSLKPGAKDSHDIGLWCTRHVHMYVEGYDGEITVDTPSWSSCQDFSAVVYEKDGDNGQRLICLAVTDGGQASEIMGGFGDIMTAIGSAAMASKGVYLAPQPSNGATTNRSTNQKCVVIGGPDLKKRK